MTQEDSFNPELNLLLREQVLLADQAGAAQILASWEAGVPEYQAAMQALRSSQRTVQTSADGQASATGWTVVSEAKDGSRVRTATIIQDLAGGPAGAAQSAVVAVFLQGEDLQTQRQFVSFVIEGEPGNLDSVQVQALGGAAAGAISPAAGTFWQRFVTCLRGSCAEACLQALATCPRTSWVVFLGCMAVRCGGCALRCSACAACDCSWWCRWAAGCCRP